MRFMMQFLPPNEYGTRSSNRDGSTEHKLTSAQHCRPSTRQRWGSLSAEILQECVLTIRASTVQLNPRGHYQNLGQIKSLHPTNCKVIMTPGANTLVAPDFPALTIGIVAYFMGVIVTRHVVFLTKYNVPEPVTGGFIAIA
jgi:hypothetical protein